MPDTDSSNSGLPDAEADAPEELCQVPKVHPFFLPLSAKRTRASSAADKEGDHKEAASEAAIDSQQPKRPKQKVTGIALAPTVAASSAAATATGEKRGRKPKSGVQTIQGSAVGKSAKIHSFFAVNTKRSAVQSPAISMQQEQACIDAESVSSAHIDAATGNSDAASAYPTPAFEAPKPRRPLFRSTGIPAPYPTEYTHVPAPVYTPFEQRAGLTQSDRFPVGSVDSVTLQGVLSGLAYARPIDLVDGGCVQWRQCLSSEMSAEQIPDRISVPGTYTVIRATPARTIPDAATMPHVPAHLQFAVPFLESLCNQDVQPDKSASATQLLALRCRPKRASGVLGNRRAVLRLHSWIEGMRLKRPSSTLENDAPSVPDKPAGKPGFRFGRGPRRVAKNRIGSSGSGSDSKSDSSDDFMPQKSLRSRRARNNDMDDVMAWAQSDGTINSVRELKRAVPRRHRRQGSSGSASETESFSNVILLEGPSGSGKTAAVYACAEESGFEVYEIHPGQRRSGKDVLAILEDVILSHTISNSTGSGNARMLTAADSAISGAVNQLLILIEEVDVLFEQDIRLWPALKQLALKSRRPIVLTCTDSNCVRWDSFSFHSVLRFTRPTESILVPYCFLLCLSEGTLVSPVDLVELCRNTACDINRILCELDIVIRRVTIQQQSSVSDSIESSDSTWLDLGGALSWLFNPLDPGETPESRYSFWMDLIGSVQPATRDISNETWFHMWPEAPPTFGDLSLSDTASSTRPPIATAHLNSFHAQRTRAAAAVASGTLLAATTSQHSDISTSLSPGLLSLPVLVSSVSISAEPSDLTETRPAQIQSQPEVPMSSSDLEQLEIMSAALDTLSLSCVYTRETPAQRECQMEPLHSTIAPMSDGCLDVSYVVLDFDVLTRHNTTLLPDSSNANGQRTIAELDSYLKSSASVSLLNTLAPEMEQKVYTDEVDRMLESQEASAPFTPPPEMNKRGIIRNGLNSAVDFVSMWPQRCEPDRMVETAGYLSLMVTWDWIHQGKVPPPRHHKLESETRSESTQSSDNGLADHGIQHLYRIGNRRTRMNTYRAHIKRMPTEMQQSIVDWSNFE